MHHYYCNNKNKVIMTLTIPAHHGSITTSTPLIINMYSNIHKLVLSLMIIGITLLKGGVLTHQNNSIKINKIHQYKIQVPTTSH